MHRPPSARRSSCSAVCPVAMTAAGGAQLRPGPALAARARGRGGAGRGRADPRRRHRHGHGRGRAARARRLHRRRARPERRDARRRPRALRSEPAGRRRASSSIEDEAERLPFADGDVRRAHVHLPAALRRRSAGDAARAGPRRTSRRACRLAGVRRSAARRAARGWRLYTPSVCPRSGGCSRRDWAEVGRFLGPSIAGFYDRHPLDAIAGYWREAGLRDVSVRRMSFGAGVVMSRTASSGAGVDAREH